MILLGSLSHTHTHDKTHFEWEEGYWEVCHEVWYSFGISWFRTLFLFMFRKIWIYVNTNTLTQSQVYLPTHKCHMNTLLVSARCQGKKKPKNHANTLYDALWHYHYALENNRRQRRPPVALRGFCIEMTVQSLFKTRDWCDVRCWPWQP